MKRNSGILFLSGLLASTQVMATLTPTFERGEKNVYHNSPRGVQEVCVIPKKYPEVKYSAKDIKKETELCNLSFYDVTTAEAANGIEGTALCAKLNSTNPAINVYELKQGQTKASVESTNCNDASKLGKYKNSTSCSYTPAIVGYYHLSRILGNIGRVPVSVLRSMDIETHKKIAGKGMSGTKTTDLINQTWAGLNSILTSGLGSTRKDLVLSDDGQQSYGGLIINPKQEEFYKEFFNTGADRAIAFLNNNAIFKLVKDERSLDKVVGSDWTQENVQKLYAMQDVTEFILLDHIMDQQDRFGNIAYQSKQAYLTKENTTDQSYDVEMASDLKDYEKDKANGLVKPGKAPLVIKAMVLKDNDCGVSKTNVVKQAQLLKYIRHMNPKTYRKLLQFQASVTENKSFFTSNLMFTAKDYEEMVANVNDAATILKTNCQRGVLKLDLAIDHYLDTGALKIGSCEIE